MRIESLIFQLLVGISTAMLYWIVSVGLTFTFGVTRVLNFAHGSFYMFGAYLTLALFTATGSFVASLIIASLCVGLIGILCERGLIRFSYALPVPFQLVLTFGLVLVFEDVVRLFWGTAPRVIPSLGTGTFTLMGRRFPLYSVYLIIIGALIGGLLYLAINRTKWGVMIRAMISDIDLAMANGINPEVLYSSSFFVGSFLAGLGGALSLPIGSASPGMGEHIIIYSFIVTVMGGLGNIKGAFVASLIIGIAESLGALYFPNLTMAIPYLILASILVYKPEGIYGEV
ncbi:MAG: branched-chain amino acid ABC transporter permease [Deltaproteobacteria bacterium]|nr:branched-chain amino acid ABC transporter permease [Deltaproteobacteria bacterium]NIS77652.1 branched-chain amino acid ABC transporter permease [Deltaproteobacteria bacterium]